MAKNLVSEMLRREAEKGEAKVVPIDITKLQPYTGYRFPRISDEDRATLKKSIQENGVHDPLQVVAKNGAYIVLTGATRLEIAMELSMETLPCIVRQLPPSEWEDLLIEDNVARRQLSLDQKKELVPVLRKGGKSLRAIAEILKMGKSTVGETLQADLGVRGRTPGEGSDNPPSGDSTALGEIPATITGRDGKKYSSQKPGKTKVKVRKSPLEAVVDPLRREKELSNQEQEMYQILFMTIESHVLDQVKKSWPQHVIIRVLEDLIKKYSS